MTERFDQKGERVCSRAGSSGGPELALQVWHRRKWIGILVFTAVLTGVVAAVVSLPSLYRASATVLVDRQEVSEAFVRPSVTAELETRIQTIHQRVMSRARLAEVIVRLGLYPELREVVSIDQVVDRIRRDIDLRLRGVDQASGRTATIAFTLSFTGRHPQTVADVANTLAGFYVQENTDARQRQAAQTAAFLGKQLALIKEELDERERRVSEFSGQHADELRVEANAAVLDRLNARLRLNGEYQLRNLDRRDRIEDHIAGAGLSGSAGQEPTTPGAQLLKLKLERAELVRKFSAEYPDVVQVDAEIAALERHLTQAKPAGNGASAPADPEMSLNPSLAEVNRELGALKEEEALLRRSIAVYEARVEAAPAREREVEDMSREREAARERYRALLKQYEDAQLAASLEEDQNVERFRVLDPAIPPGRPAAPNRLWLAMMGLFASLACGVGAVLAVERVDTTFHTADDLRAFADIPTLATLRQVPTRAVQREKRFRAALAGCGAIAILALIAAGTHYVAGGNEQLARMAARGD